jgi:hypothetical protein
MPAQAQPNNDLTLSEKMKIVQYLAILPALTIMVFTRRKLGFRMLKPARLIGMAFFLSFLNDLSNLLPFSHGAGVIFSEFPLVMLIFGFGQRYRRWKELCRGERWHTYSPGISWLELLPLPAMLKAHRRIYRFVEPISCFIFSMFFGIFFSQPLARWFAFSAFAMFIYEQSLFDRQLDRDLDILDGLVAAEVQTQTVDHFAGSQPDEEQRTMEETAGIPTGVAFDIHKQIETLRAKQTVEDEKSKAEAFVRQVQQVKMAAGAMPRDITPSVTQLLPPAPDNMVKDPPDNPA